MLDRSFPDKKYEIKDAIRKKAAETIAAIECEIQKHYALPKSATSRAIKFIKSIKSLLADHTSSDEKIFEAFSARTKSFIKTDYQVYFFNFLKNYTEIKPRFPFCFPRKELESFFIDKHLLTEQESARLCSVNSRFYKLFSPHYSQKRERQIGMPRDYSDLFKMPKFDDIKSTYQKERIISTPNQKVTAIESLSNQNYALGYQDGTVAIFHENTFCQADKKNPVLSANLEKSNQQTQEHKAVITSIIRFKNSNIWSTSSADGSVIIWDETNKPIFTISKENNSEKLFVSHQGFVCCAKEKSIRIYSILQQNNNSLGKPVDELSACDYELNFQASSFDVLPDGSYVIGKPFIEAQDNVSPIFEGVLILNPINGSTQTIPDARFGFVLSDGNVAVIKCHQTQDDPYHVMRDGWRDLWIYNLSKQQMIPASMQHYYGSTFHALALPQQCYLVSTEGRARLYKVKNEGVDLINAVTIKDYKHPYGFASYNKIPTDRITKTMTLSDGNIATLINDGSVRLIEFPILGPALKMDDKLFKR